VEKEALNMGMMGAMAVPTQWTDVISLADATSPATWLREVGRKLDLIRDAGENWDGEGGAPIHPRIVGIASELLVPLKSLGLPVPRIAPVLGGGIQFEWNVADKELEVEILPDGTVEYLTATGGAEVQEGELPGVPTREVLDLARRLLTER